MAPRTVAEQPATPKKKQAGAAVAVAPETTAIPLKDAKAAKAAKPAKAQKAAKPAKTAKAPKAAKPVRAKLVRDSFSFPSADHQVLQQLKDRAAKLGRPTKKNEVLRAGVQALAGLGDAAFLAMVGSLPEARPAKPGKPAKA